TSSWPKSEPIPVFVPSPGRRFRPFSRIRTGWPARRSAQAAALPPAPDPTTITDALLTAPSVPFARARTARAAACGRRARAGSGRPCERWRPRVLGCRRLPVRSPGSRCSRAADRPRELALRLPRVALEPHPPAELRVPVEPDEVGEVVVAAPEAPGERAARVDHRRRHRERPEQEVDRLGGLRLERAGIRVVRRT